MKRIRSYIPSRKTLITIVVIALIIGGFVWWRVSQKASAKPPASAKVTRGTIKEVLSLSGEVNAVEKASLAFQSGGLVTWLGVQEGDAVTKYQGLASLDTRIQEKNIKKYLNHYMTARWTFDQAVDDNDTWTAQPTDDLARKMKRLIDEAQFNLDNSVLDVEIQTLAKETSYLSSPIDGIVTHVPIAAAGTNIGPTQTFDIINPDTIYFDASADQTEVVRLHQGMPTVLTFDSFPDEQIHGTVSDISYLPKTNETGTVYGVKVYFTDPKGLMRYRMGMTGDSDFTMQEKKNVVTVPVQFIRNEGDKKYVSVQTAPNTYVKREIKTGLEGDENIEVVSGLSVGETVVDVKL